MANGIQAINGQPGRYNASLQTANDGMGTCIATDVNGRIIVSPVAAGSTINIVDIGGTAVVTGGVAGLIAVAGNVGSAVTDAGNPLKIGGVFNTTQPTVTTGQRVDGQSTNRGAQIVATGVDTFNVTVNAALPTGSNVIGALSANQSANVAQINGVTPLMGNGVTGTGSQRVTIASDNTAFTVNAAQSGTWNINNISGTVSLPTGASTAAKQPALGTAGAASADVISVQGIASMTKLLVTPDSVALPANQSVNVAQINGVTTTMGNGVSGTGVQRVTIASDSTGQITLATGANVIGALSANQSVNAAQINGVTTTTGNGVSGTGVQRVTLASDSTGQVALATGSNTIGALTANQSVNNNQVAGAAISTAASGVQKVGVTGNTGAAVDAAGQNVAAPANEIIIGGQFNTTPTTITTGNVSPIQVDSKGSQRVVNQDAAGNVRGANVDANNRLTVGTELTPVGTALNTYSIRLTTNRRNIGS